MGRKANPARKVPTDYDYKLVRVFKPLPPEAENDPVEQAKRKLNPSTVSLQHWDYVRLMRVSRLPPEGFNRYIRQVANTVPDPGGNRWSKAVVEQVRLGVEAGQAFDPLDKAKP